MIADCSIREYHGTVANFLLSANSNVLIVLYKCFEALKCFIYTQLLVYRSLMAVARVGLMCNFCKSIILY